MERLPSPALAAAMLAALVAGCGLKTAPRPLEATEPVLASPPTLELAADGRVSIAWKRAKRSRDGARVYDLAGFRIERDSGKGFEEVGRVLVNDNERIRPQQDFETLDADAGPGLVSYRVRAFLADGQTGGPSPASSITVPAD